MESLYSFLNLNLIFQTINNQLTNNKGLDYLNEE